MRNRYYERSRLSPWKFRQLARYFVMDLSATDTAALTGLTRKTVTTIFLKMRQRIARECELDAMEKQEGMEVKTAALFSIARRGDLICTRPVPDDKMTVSPSADYEAFIDVRRLKLVRISRQVNTNGDGASHDNSVESFWSFAKRRLQKFNGVSQRTSYLHLKECEWRFNLRRHDLYAELLKLLRAHPL